MSVAENVTFQTKELIDSLKLERSIRKAGMEEKIQSLKNGVGATLTKHLEIDGVELSGGEYRENGDGADVI